MRRHLLAIALSALSLLLLLVSAQEDVTCYKPDGTSHTFDGTVICNSVEGSVSMCCGLNDICLQNGMCKVKVDEDAGVNATYWRDGCSISSWPDVGCLKVCTGDNQIDELGNASMTPCDGTDYSETWCCGTTTDCCGTDAEITVPANIYVASTSASTSTSTSTSISTNTSSTTSNVESTPTESAASHTHTSSSDESHSSSGLSGGSKAGIGVGVAAGVIALVGALSFFVLRRRRRNAATPPEISLYQPVQSQKAAGTPDLQAPVVHEKPADKQHTRYE
ncbi:hypothetical protein BJY01DRAFT_259393 [Aspergillus pseudoustus]|uniref:Mid2 domain-containing protein n=1 Tax=Aspergillus pseudoustus TaxID=1810923 RepID=A0ABR4J4S1_9EURO